MDTAKEVTPSTVKVKEQAEVQLAQPLMADKSKPPQSKPGKVRRAKTPSHRRKARLGLFDCLENLVGTWVSGVACNPIGWLCCRPIKESVASSLVYVLTMLTAVACCMVLSSDWIVSLVLNEIIDDNSSYLDVFWKSLIRKWFGYYGVYRICTVMALFHVVLALVTTGAPNSNSFRGRIHHGYWMFKYTLIYFGLFAMAYVPLDIVYVRICFTLTCVIGGLLFTVIKFLALIEDFYITHQSYSKLKHQSIWMRFRYYAFSVMITLVNWALIVLVCTVTLLCRRPECRLFEIVIYSMTGLCFLLTLASVAMHSRTKKVLQKQALESEQLMKGADNTLKREEAKKRIELGRKATATLALRKSRSGWFEGSMVSLYVLYLTLAAIDTVPAALCTKCMQNNTVTTTASSLAISTAMPSVPETLMVNSKTSIATTTQLLNASLSTSSDRPKRSRSRIRIPNLGSVREYEDDGNIYVSCTFYRALLGLFRQPLENIVKLEIDLGVETPFNINEALHLAVRFYAYIGLFVMTILTCAACMKLTRQTSDYGDTLPMPASKHGRKTKPNSKTDAAATAAAAAAADNPSTSAARPDGDASVELIVISAADRSKSANSLASPAAEEVDIVMRKVVKTKKVYPQFGSILRDELEKTRYNYTAFHLIVMGAYLYVMATLTNWYNPKLHSTIEKTDSYMESYVIRMVSAGTVFCAYLFRLLFPRTSILPQTVFKRYRLSFIHGKVQRKRNELSKSSDKVVSHL